MISASKPDVPRTMDNCFGEEIRCDHCGAKFAGRDRVWVWHEHTACSRACVVAAKELGDTEPLNRNTPILAKAIKETDLL